MMAMMVVMPGPDFALVSKISLLEGQRQGQAAALGVGLGIIIHTCAAMFGISAIIVQSTVLFQILKYLGALYLFCLGIQALWQSRRLTSAVLLKATGRSSGMTSAHAFRQGLLTNVLNPKAVIIFLTFLPQFMEPDLPLWPQTLELGGITALLCVLWFVPLASILDRVRKFFEDSRVRQWLARCTGMALILFGLRLVVVRQE